MASQEPDTLSVKKEELFNDFLQRGDDFAKIEIFRSALTWYNRALEMDIEQDKVRIRIDRCNRELKFERKVFSILGAVALVAITSYLVFF